MNLLERRVVDVVQGYLRHLASYARLLAEAEGEFRRTGCVAQADEFLDRFTEVDAILRELRSSMKILRPPARR